MDFVRKKMRRIGASQLVEDGVQRERKAEKRSTNTIMVSQRVFATLVDRKVLGNTPIPRGGPVAYMCLLFTPPQAGISDLCMSHSELVPFECCRAPHAPLPFEYGAWVVLCVSDLEAWA